LRGVVSEPLQQTKRVRMRLALGLAPGAVGLEAPCPSLFRIASAMIERAELPVQRKRTFWGLSVMTSLSL
jgi:hypothetical protein